MNTRKYILEVYTEKEKKYRDIFLKGAQEKQTAKNKQDSKKIQPVIKELIKRLNSKIKINYVFFSRFPSSTLFDIIVLNEEELDFVNKKNNIVWKWTLAHELIHIVKNHSKIAKILFSIFAGIGITAILAGVTKSKKAALLGTLFTLVLKSIHKFILYTYEKDADLKAIDLLIKTYGKNINYNPIILSILLSSLKSKGSNIESLSIKIILRVLSNPPFNYARAKYLAKYLTQKTGKNYIEVFKETEDLMKKGSNKAILI